MFMPSPAASAAVAIIQCQTPRDCYLILRRAAHPKDPWSGHFSFPGGRRESGDQDLLATCIRETAEETGIILTPAHLQRRLVEETAGHYVHQPIIVQPFLFSVPEPPRLHLAEGEIQGAMWLDTAQFKDPSLHKNVEMIPGHFFPAFPIEDYYLWGFTYRLLQTLLKIEN